MGTDIHNRFHKKVDNNWVEIDLPYGDYNSEYYINRHYILFSVLADVRNGYGFAGVKTYDSVTPISEPRGFPDDMKNERDEYSAYWGDESDDCVFYGEHSYSWLSGDEILKYFDESNEKTERVGVISKEQFREWDKVTPLDNFSGGVSGGSVNIYDCVDRCYNNIDDIDNYTHFKVYWLIDVKQDIIYFRDLIQKLVNDHGEIRMVFGFDS